jgi:putative ABC transport system ATP-binding protein
LPETPWVRLSPKVTTTGRVSAAGSLLGCGTSFGRLAARGTLVGSLCACCGCSAICFCFDPHEDTSSATETQAGTMKAERVRTSLLSTVMSFTPAQEILQVRDLTKTIQNGANRVEILRGLSFSVARGEFIAIMGASGSGKSTLLGLMAGLDNATSGEVILDGINITGMAEDRLARVRGTKIGFVFQSYQLVSTLTAEENVLLPAELIGLRGNIEDRARELLDRVGLQNRRHHYPVQLSGGEQQRVALARAFITSAPILMADEPTGNLDSVNGAHILELLLRLNREEKTTLILVTHDPQLAAHADRVITLRDGSLVADQAPAQFSRS